MEPASFNIVGDAIARINAAQTPADLHRVLETSMDGLGFEHILFALAPSIERDAFERLVVFKRWPDAWFEQYRHAQFHAHDPIARYVRTQLNPFDWSAAPPSDDPVARHLMASSADDFGMRHGRCIPVCDFLGYRAAISLAGREDAHSGPLADLIAIYAFNKLNGFHADDRKSRLTDREREAVTWAAAGKSAWETGVILRVSEKTVEKHLMAAMRKYGAHSKAQIVAACLRAGEVSL